MEAMSRIVREVSTVLTLWVAAFVLICAGMGAVTLWSWIR